MGSDHPDNEPHYSGMSDDFNPLEHRPHKTIIFYLRAFAATAAFRIWPHLLFIGGWSAMIVCVSTFTKAELAVPNTMITVLGVLLGLSLTYRTSTANEKYNEGRRQWSSIIQASRNWARYVWIHCPDSVSADIPTDPMDKARDEARGVLEKKTMVQLALGFAVSVKHYLRQEEGIYYEDLYHLVNFIPALDFPSGIPSEADAHIAAGLPRRDTASYACSESTTSAEKPTSGNGNPRLQPASIIPEFHWSDLCPTWLSDKRKKNREEEKRHRAMCAHQIGHNVPLEIVMFMSSWVNVQVQRKKVDIQTIAGLMRCTEAFTDALTTLERILTTPIPWSYNAHIWTVSWAYCIFLPFQLYGSNFKWVTIPASVLTAYIVMGYASIAKEIENPFGYDPNDLNLGFFTREIIARELDAITARPFPDPGEWVFSGTNHPFGPDMPGANRLAELSLQDIRGRLSGAEAHALPRRTSQVWQTRVNRNSRSQDPERQ